MSNFVQDTQFLSSQKDIHILGNGWIQDGTNLDGYGNTIQNNYHTIAQDSSLITQPNATVPAELLSYWDPKAVKVLTAKRAATEMYDEVKKGDFADQLINFRMDEITGATVPYSDYGNSGESSTNYNWPHREVYRFQTHINVGDLEAEMAGKAKIGLVAEKQRAAAEIMQIDANKFYLYGVSGKTIYGALNDPSLPTAISPLTDADSNVTWEDKDVLSIYNDVLELYNDITDRMQGNVSPDMPITLSVSPKVSVYLAKASTYNVSVMDLLGKFFSNLKVVLVPELSTSTVNTVQMQVSTVLAQKTGECIAPEKFRTYPVFRRGSSIEQKVAGATAGCVIYRPSAISIMTGV